MTFHMGMIGNVILSQLLLTQIFQRGRLKPPTSYLLCITSFFGYFGRLFVLSCYTNLQRPGDQWILPTSMFKKKQVPAIPAIYQLYTSYTPAIYQLLVTLLTFKKQGFFTFSRSDFCPRKGRISPRGAQLLGSCDRVLACDDAHFLEAYRTG